MVFLVNIALILVLAFYAGLFCSRQKNSLWHLFLGFNLPFAAMVVMSWIFQAPWFWYVIQWILQALVLWAAFRFEEQRKNHHET